MQCKFAIPCKYYKEDSYVCNNNDEADGYCGYHRKFKNLLIIESITRSVSNTFVPTLRGV